MADDRLERTLKELEEALGREEGGKPSKPRRVVKLTEDMIVDSPQRPLPLAAANAHAQPPADAPSREELEALARRAAREAAEEALARAWPGLARAFAEALGEELARELAPAVRRACLRAAARAARNADDDEETKG